MIEELQNESPEAPELQQLRQQQLAELDALLVAGASPEHREKLGSEAAQQRELQHKLAKKREELALLETSLHLAGAKDDEPATRPSIRFHAVGTTNTTSLSCPRCHHLCSP